MPAVDRNGLGKADRRQSENFGHLLGHGARVAVGRLGTSDDQVVVARLADGAGKHLGRGERISAGQRRVRDEHGLLGAHGEGGTQTGYLIVRGHRDQGDRAFASGVNELERHFDAIAVRLIQDELPVSLQRVGRGIQLTRQCRVRDLFHTDDHVHKAHKLPPGQLAHKAGTQVHRAMWPDAHARPVSPSSSGAARRDRPGRRDVACQKHRPGTVGVLGGGAAVKVLLIVNSFASSVTARNTVVVHRRLSQGHDVEIVETNRRGHATRFAHDAARRGVDVVIGYGGDGTLNEVATGIAGTELRSACFLAAPPMCSHARSVCRTIHSRLSNFWHAASTPLIFDRLVSVR